MMLPPDAVQIGSGLLSLGTFGLVLRLSFVGGRLFQRFEQLETRVEHLEGSTCPHPECPVKAHFALATEKGK